MKKTIILFTLVLGSFSAVQAQTLDMSFGQVTNMNVYRMKIQVSEDITYKWLTVTPYGGWETWSQWSSNRINGLPFRDTYSIGIKTTLFDNWYVDVNHYCYHNVVLPTIDQSKYQYTKDKVPWDQSLTTVSIGYHKKFSSLLM
jgi:hypothetical protein